MKIKSLAGAILFVCILFLNSCGGLGKKDYTEMPTGAEFEKVYNAVMEDKKEGVEFYEIYGQFDAQSMSMSPSTSMSITYMPAKNTTKLYQYSRNMSDGMWIGPTEVTLHERILGEPEGEALSRDQFTDVMFNIEDMPAFSQFDEIYKKALSAAGLGNESCVVRFRMTKEDDENKFSITVGMKEKGNKTEKDVFFDKAGNVIEQ